ncbi:hypothetical protein [Sphingomonas cavernae]|uniref:Uncharacterized protein n=1 Tax=Sphingomonas cavernae TaxID=2320861 RepID=A0A418WMA3_9SPHN|nr:hypothetical protein [Sphingomonas cavernae]RJF91142.1 hypothetical protein D3876_13500 [Sphingomonas cavernae]
MQETYGDTASAAVSAAAAEAAKLVAQGAETNANGYAGAAAASAANADASEAGAASSALVAAQWGNEAKGITQANRSFELGFDGWAPQVTGSGEWPSHVTTTGSEFGIPTGWLVVQAGAQAQIYSKTEYKVDPARKYKFRCRVGAWRAVGGGGSVMYVGFVGIGVDGNPVNHGAFGSYRYCLVTGTTILNGATPVFEVIVTGEGNDSWVKFPPGTVRIKLMAIVNYPGSSPDIAGYVDFIEFEDVTESQAANASANAAASSTASAGAHAALAQSSAILSAQIGGNSINKNPLFADTAADGTPGQWSIWNAPPAKSRQPGYESPYCLQISAADNANSGYTQTVTVAPGKYLLEAAVELVAGIRFEGSGMHLAVYDATGTGAAQSWNFDFCAEPTTNGEVLRDGAIVANKVYRFSKLIDITLSAARTGYLYFMNNWEGFSPGGAGRYAKTLKWHRVSLRPASDPDIQAASVKQLAGALASIQGRTEAYWQTELNASSGASAFMAARVNTNDPTLVPVDLMFLFSAVRPVQIATEISPRCVRKVGGESAWGQFICYTKQRYTNHAYVEASFGVGAAAFIGLNSDAYPGYWANMDYGIHQDGATTIVVYENGTFIASYFNDAKPTDRWSIRHVGSAVQYARNGKVFRVVAAPGSVTYYAQVDIYNVGAEVNNLVFSSQGPSWASSVAFGADEISLWNPAGGGLWKKAAAVAGGDATFYGNLNVGGGIYVGGLKIPVALQAFNISVYDGQVVSYGASLGTIPLLTPDFSGFPALPSGQSYVFRAESHTPTGFTARVKKSTAATPTTSTTGAGTSPGTGPTFQANKAVASDAYDGNYSFRVTGTMYRQTDTVDIGDGGPVKTVYHGYIRFQSWFRPAGGSWTEGPIVQVNAGAGTDGNQPYDKTFIANFGSAIGLDASNTEFGVSISSTYGVGINTLTGLTSVSHTYYSGATESTATPGNLPLLPLRVNPQNG